MTPCQFIVEIRHASNIDVPEKRRLHRLPVGSSAADLRPPEGIAWLGLEEIVLELDYSYVAKELEQRSEDDDVRAGQLDQSLRRVGFGLKGPEDEPTHEDDVVLHRRHSLDDSPLPIEDDELVVWKIDTFPMSGLCSPPDGIVGERPRLGAQERSITARGALELADAAFRSIVRPKPAKLAIGIWLPQVDLELDLATLAPTLWQPRYAKVYVSTIILLSLLILTGYERANLFLAYNHTCTIHRLAAPGAVSQLKDEIAGFAESGRGYLSRTRSYNTSR
jgi:hypothetical protein